MNNLHSVNEAIKLINKSKNIYIASHIQPDGDNIGSILALGMALKRLEKDVTILKTDIIPSDLLFLPGVDLIKDYDKSEEIDLFIALDCSDADRLGENKSLILKANKVINIDHHISNTNFGHVNIVDNKASATGELIYEFLNAMEFNFNKEIATCIYTAISTDTGSFMYDSVTSKTHNIAAELIKVGIDKTNININLYQSRSIERTNLFINAFSTLKTYEKDKVATVKVTEEMLVKANAKMEDTDGIISFIRDIASVEVACLLKEFGPSDTKVSLRSKKHIDVSKICAAFNGGGHIRAAGCSINKDINTAEELIVEEIIKGFRS